jgi:hypothetical protein
LQRGFALPVGHRAARVGGTFFLVAAVGQRWVNGGPTAGNRATSRDE